ncbi:MAG: DUF3305 domain-containing protein [Alphaproteobacteria bacterium]
MSAIPETMRIGIVLERCAIDNPWQSHVWRVVATIPGAPEIPAPIMLREGPGWTQYHAATLTLELHRRETEGYKRNLANETPAVYVILRTDDEADEMPRADLATVCPYEAQDYLDGGGVDESVEMTAMPEAVRAWLADYVAAWHVDEAFKKRKRKNWKRGEPHSERQPRGSTRQRHG